MQYGHFDDDAKEYVVTRPDTPRSWTNFMGDTTYGAMISNNAGGFSFYKSGQVGRFLRMRTNAVPMDQPGRYVYLRDQADGDVWSTSWQPVGKPLSEYQTTCRHGTAYTIISSEYRNIASAVTYFVALGQTWEYWKVTLTNTGDTPRSLKAFPFVEWANSWNRTQDQDNLQYTQYILDCTEHDGIIQRANNSNLPADPDDFMNDDQGRYNWMGLAGIDIDGFDTDRYTAVGPYNSYHNPQVVMNGACTGSLAQGDNGVGLFETSIDLAPGESKTFLVMLGVGTAEEGKQVIAEYGSIARCDAEYAKLVDYWHAQIGRFTCQTPEPLFNSWVNVWNAYNCLITLNWSRAASFVYNGDRDGLGFRDSVQDLMAASIIVPEQARKNLILMISGQESPGNAKRVVKPFAHKPGSEPLTDPHKIRSDDCYWLFEAVQAYVKETGDESIYDEVVPYSDQGQDTVVGHLRRAIEFTLGNMGANGLPCGLEADWNDCLRMGFKGETVFVAHQMRIAYNVYIEINERLGKPEEVSWAKQHLAELDTALAACWDGKWWIRAITESGDKFGSSAASEGSIFLNAQAWGVLAGTGSRAQQEQAIDAVDEHLYTDYGIRVCDPPYTTVPCNEVRAVLFNGGQKENGGIFNHPQGWAVMAACRLGQADRAWKWYKAFMPPSFNDKAELRGVEPYVCCQSTHAPASRRFGAGRVGWLTGCATWAYWSATTHILGILPDYTGLRVQPCLPSEWPAVTVTRQFRGKTFQITITNGGQGNTVASMSLNGQAIDGNLIPLALAGETNEVQVQLA